MYRTQPLLIEFESAHQLHQLVQHSPVHVPCTYEDFHGVSKHSPDCQHLLWTGISYEADWSPFRVMPLHLQKHRCNPQVKAPGRKYMLCLQFWNSHLHVALPGGRASQTWGLSDYYLCINQIVHFLACSNMPTAITCKLEPPKEVRDTSGGGPHLHGELLQKSADACRQLIAAKEPGNWAAMSMGVHHQEGCHRIPLTVGAMGGVHHDNLTILQGSFDA